MTEIKKKKNKTSINALNNDCLDCRTCCFHAILCLENTKDTPVEAILPSVPKYLGQSLMWQKVWHLTSHGKILRSCDHKT